MIYLDTSVLYATLLGEERQPPASFWSVTAISSRLLEFEVIVRLNARARPHGALAAARKRLERVQMVELHGQALQRALLPFPVPLRTLDAIHLSTLLYLQGRGIDLELATYDKRMARAAGAMGVPLAEV